MGSARWFALDAFWQSIWDYFTLQSPTPHRAVLAENVMPGAVWFPGAQVNDVQQVLRHVAPAHAAGLPAIVARNERSRHTEPGWPELRRQVASLALHLRAAGVQRGDRVAAYLPNVRRVLLWDNRSAAQIAPDFRVPTQDFTLACGRNDAETTAFELEWLPFGHPLWIVYSSGTTGLPKPIVHGHGGTALVAKALKVLREGPTLDDALRSKLSEAIRRALSPRFVADAIEQVAEIARTLSGKKQELPIKRLLLGQPLEKVINKGAMANPGCLGWYVDDAHAYLAATAAAAG